MRKWMVVLALMGSPTGVWAAEPEISDAWVRLPPPVSDTTAAYMTLINRGGRPLVIAGMDSRAAKKTIMHGVNMKAGMMHMYPLAHLSIPAHGTIRFEPGGRHIMLSGLSQRLHAGGIVRIHLRFANGSSMTVDAPVRDMRERSSDVQHRQR